MERTADIGLALCDLPPLEPDADQHLDAGCRGHGYAAFDIPDGPDHIGSGRIDANRSDAAAGERGDRGTLGNGSGAARR